MITHILASSKREGRFDIQVGGRYFATVSLDTIDRLKLKVGAEVSPELEAAIKHDEAALKTFDRALAMIDFRPRAIKELRRQLLRKGEPEEHIGPAIEKLTRLGILNDTEYARVFTRVKSNGPGYSRRRISQELSKRGVAREVAQQAIGDAVERDEINEQDTLRRVAEKKLRTLSRYDPDTQKRRLYAFLARRGFASDDIRNVMSRVLAERVEAP
jgi:regulatory protein